MLKAYIKQHLTENPCVDCGLTNRVCLEFDHVRGKKVGNVSTLVREGVSLKVLKEEVDKCVVRCSNCHKIKTAIEQRWDK